RLATDGIQPPPGAPAVLDQLAERLWQQRGHSLVVCGTQDVAHQGLCNLINEGLGNYGAAGGIAPPSCPAQGSRGELQQLLQELREHRVDALLVLECNPVFDLPEGAEIGELLRQVPLSVVCAERVDETAETARYVCPVSHPLAAWGDAEPVR